jgi:hypothetical protein
VARAAAGWRRSLWKLLRVRILQEADLAVACGRARLRWSPGSVEDGDDHALPKRRRGAG